MNVGAFPDARIVPRNRRQHHGRHHHDPDTKEPAQAPQTRPGTGIHATHLSRRPDPAVELLRVGRERNGAGLSEVAQAAGVVHGVEVTPIAPLDVLDPVLERLRHEQVTFTRDWLRSLTMRYSEPRSAASRSQRKLPIPTRYLLVQRVAAGTTGVLCLLGASLPLTAEAVTSLPGLDSGAVTGAARVSSCRAPRRQRLRGRLLRPVVGRGSVRP
jgi:hypothetical protein